MGSINKIPAWQKSFKNYLTQFWYIVIFKLFLCQMLTQNLFPIVKWPNCAFSYCTIIALIVYAENIPNIIENKEIFICTLYLQCLLFPRAPQFSLTCLFKSAHAYPILSIWGIQNALVAEYRTTTCILIRTRAWIRISSIMCTISVISETCYISWLRTFSHPDIGPVTHSPAHITWEWEKSSVAFFSRQRV